MNAPVIEPDRWPRQRWLYAVSGVLLLQALLVVALGRRDPRIAERPIFRTSVVLLADPTNAHAFLTKVDDPTMFAMPTVSGFSGSAWLKFTPLEYQPAEWVEPPQWLSLNASNLGSSFSQFVSNNAARPALVVDKPLPSPVDLEPHYPNEPVARESLLRIEGELATRRRLNPLQLKSWASSELLSNSVVQAVVDSDGFVLSAVLLKSSGSSDADSYASELSAAVRFEPLQPAVRNASAFKEASVAFGTLIFEWHTLAPQSAEVPARQP